MTPFTWRTSQIVSAGEKNALVSLAKIDGQMAMDLFREVEDAFGGDIPEDVCANAATYIFAHYCRSSGTKGLPMI